jgi:alanine dehydrogenase
MIVGILKEIKAEENRVSMTPAGVEVMKRNGHTLLVEKNAGVNSGFDDASYANAGAEVLDTPGEIYARSDMVMHVKEPLPSEYELIREGQIIFTYLHLAALEELTNVLIQKRSVNIAYETIQKADGSLPLLTPMSEVAGRMAIQAGAYNLEITQGGDGILLGGVPGVEPARVLVIGGGVVGINAARMAMGLGADVTILDRSLQRLQELEMLYGGRMKTVFSTTDAIERYALEADLVVGAVLIPGAAAPRLISRDLVKRMKKGAVMVDVAIDQGGCFETSKATTHQDPTYIVDGVVHYCVANMPGGVARTSTIALTNATLPYALQLAGKGVAVALQEDVHLRNGLNVHAGMVTHEAVAEALGYDYVDALTALSDVDEKRTA